MMRKNVMILFFSVLRVESGVIKLREAQYLLENGRQETGVQTNEAALYDVVDTLAAEGGRLDKIYCFATPAAMSAETGAPIEVRDGEEIHRYGSQLEFWRHRVTASRPVLKDTEILEVPYAYPEDKEIYQKQSAFDLVDESRSCVAEMAAAVKAGAGTPEDWKECHIYADITGGFRHANMMLTAVIQFLQYDGMKLEKVVYSDFQAGRLLNKVFDFKDINDLYKLVSGADEFVKYGSSKAIEEYFGFDPDQGAFRGEKFSEPLRELLGAMRQFSDVIQICQTGMVLPALRELARTLEQFEGEEERSSKEQIFAQLLSTVREGYRQILPEEDRSEEQLRLRIIRWCRDKGLLQQAMTLCTEWIPEYLVNRHLCYPPDRLLAAVQSVDDKLHSSWQKTYIISPVLALNSINMDGAHMLIDQAASAWHQGEYLTVRGRSAAETRILDALCQLPDLLRQLQRRGSGRLRDDELERLFKGHETERAVLQAVQAESEAARGQTFAQFLLANPQSLVEGKLIHKKDGRLLMRLCGNHVYQLKYDSDRPEREKARQIWQQMFAGGAAVTCFNQQKVCRCLQEYAYLRQQRNQINHANADHVMSRQEVIGLIDSCLQSLQDVEEDNG